MTATVEALGPGLPGWGGPLVPILSPQTLREIGPQHLPEQGVIVGQPVAVFPPPDTPQYGGDGKRYERRATSPQQLPSPAVQRRGWAQAHLQNRIDREAVQENAFIRGGRRAYEASLKAKWYLAQTDGWVLNFIDVYGHPWEPEAWVDLRTVRRVDAETLPMAYMLACPHQIRLCLSSGVFSFQVPSVPDAVGWVEAIECAINDNRMHQQELRALALENAEATRTHVVQAREVHDMMLHPETFNNVLLRPPAPIPVSEGRRLQLKGLWGEAVRISTSRPLPRELLEELWILYDFDGNGDLSFDELEVMVRELAMVRRQTLEQTMFQLLMLLRTSKKFVYSGDAVRELNMMTDGLAEKLKEGYDLTLDRGTSLNRLTIMRSRLDLSCDGVVTIGEFVGVGQALFFPTPELSMEAKFYAKCSRVGELFRNEDDHEEAGCLQQ